MIQAFKRWLAKAAYDGLQQNTRGIEEARINKLHDMFSNNMAAMVAFKIDNGFVVRTMNPDDAIHGARMPGFVYCADHQAIADHLIASSVKDKMGIAPQSILEAEQQAKQRAYGQAISAQVAQQRRI